MESNTTKQALLILSELDNDDLNWIAKESRRENLETNQTLIYKGRRINYLYLVLGGTLSVFLDRKELAKLGKGEVVGEISFIDNRPPTATVKAIEKSQILSISHLKIEEKLQRDEGFASRFYHGLLLCLSDRIRGTIGRLGHGIKIEESERELEEPNEILAERLELAEAKFNWLANYAGQGLSI
ncbi:MAG: cyclic nucleotide-binding domain-containing protein [Cyanobacteriota bacterium]|nr:cyclic nucleotide-binding domain-containing protein [Cyanobacteriota bacterium]